MQIMGCVRGLVGNNNMPANPAGGPGWQTRKTGKQSETKPRRVIEFQGFQASRPGLGHGPISSSVSLSAPTTVTLDFLRPPGARLEIAL